MDISVLQGSILGVILFLLYINDLPNATDLCKFSFADDSTCLAKDRHLCVLKTYLETEIQKLTWFRANKLALIMGKTHFVVSNGSFIGNTILLIFTLITIILIVLIKIKLQG